MTNAEIIANKEKQHQDFVIARLCLNLARNHMVNNQSAVLCWIDANKCINRGAIKSAIERAHSSLLHSVGCFHADTKTVKAQLIGR